MGLTRDTKLLDTEMTLIFSLVTVCITVQYMDGLVTLKMDHHLIQLKIYLQIFLTIGMKYFIKSIFIRFLVNGSLYFHLTLLGITHNTHLVSLWICLITLICRITHLFNCFFTFIK